MPENRISPLADVHPDARIGKNVVIDAFVKIEANVEIMDNCCIHSHVVVLSGTRIASGCRIHSHAVIGGVPQDLKFKGEETYLYIGENNVIRECVTVNRGTNSRGYTKIGDNNLIMAYAHVAHDCEVGNNTIIGNAVQIAGEVCIDDYAIISGGALVHQFVSIGGHVMIQGGSRVTKDIPPYTLIGREPISYCGINIVGLRRRGYSNTQIFLINDIYRTLYSKGLNNTEALELIEKEYEDCQERNNILEFIKQSKRGIVRGGME